MGAPGDGLHPVRRWSLSGGPAGCSHRVTRYAAASTDGGALFLRTYRHLYEGEKRVQAARLEALVRTSLDKEGTLGDAAEVERLKQAADESGRTWDRTRDLPRVKRALSR